MRLSLYRRADRAIVAVPEVFLPSILIDPAHELIYLGVALVDDASIGWHTMSDLEQRSYAILAGDDAQWMASHLLGASTRKRPSHPDVERRHVDLRRRRDPIGGRPTPSDGARRQRH